MLRAVATVLLAAVLRMWDVITTLRSIQENCLKDVLSINHFVRGRHLRVLRLFSEPQVGGALPDVDPLADQRLRARQLLSSSHLTK